MEQRLSLVTLGVADLARSRDFYERLGWERSAKNADGVAFFQAGGMILSLYPRDKLAEDAGVPEAGAGFRAFALAHNARSKADVEAVLAEAVAAGATLVKAAEDVFWGGYSGYFADPDGFLWEVAWNPFFPIAEDGSISLPD
jgi:uncharacterized protein